MPWPGAPKSQQSPPINPPSVRKFPSLNENSTMGDVANAVKVAFDGLTNHEQAFANIPAQIASQATAAATTVVNNIQSQTTTGVISFNSKTGAVIYFPNLGRVNDQLGNTIYLTQLSDAGQKIIMGDSSPSIVTLNPAVTPPWFAFIGNDSSATVSIQTDSTATINGLQSIYPGGMAIVFYDGATFWSEGVAIATDSSLGVVQPDGVTITMDSSGVIRANGPAGGDLSGFYPNPTVIKSEPVYTVQTGAYTFLDSNRGYLVPFNSASPLTATLPQAGASSQFLNGWFCDVVNVGAGIVTLTPTTSTINLQPTIAVDSGAGGRIVSDGTNYYFV